MAKSVSMSRLIDFNDYPMAHQPIINWIKGNGLNPRDLLRDQVAEVSQGQLTVTRFIRRPDGLLFIEAGSGEPVTQIITVPLISAPETHGL